ncbi:MAG TPA: type I-E CRISPR-associated protein Cas6/Cse3/CasE [Gammaproteobacteria bacterium]|nr:type I-E CRISPR-associated protein Cas6/Cse3/CasE [Gammaproteobacteria bacterium]
MFFSRVRVDTKALDRNALFHLMQGNGYGNHQLLWRLFPDAEARPFLFRQELEREPDPDGEGPRGLPMFYVLSDVEPQPVPGLLGCETKPYQPVLAEGQRLAFHLRANPTVARREENRKNTRRHDVLMDAKAAARGEGIEDAAALRERMDEAGRDWLADEQRAERCGYALVARPQVSRYQQHVHRRKGRDIRFSSLDYEGLLTVTDPERFQVTLARGIGHSRAFGCGLWLIRRA